MPPHAISMIDELLGDSLIQAVMRADKVEPQALRTLLAGAAGRIAARRNLRFAKGLPAKPPAGRRLTARAADSAPARLRPAPLRDCCGSALC